MDLRRIVDVRAERGPIGSLFGFGDVTLFSPRDMSDKKITLYGVRFPYELQDHIKLLHEKARSGTVSIDRI